KPKNKKGTKKIKIKKEKKGKASGTFPFPHQFFFIFLLPPEPALPSLAPARARVYPLRPCTPVPCTLLHLHSILHSCFCQKAGSSAAPDPLAVCCAEPTLLARLHSVPAS
ncbi:hypothetical protein SLEP1_g31522, partial [Rubroshorea leprosula]